MVSIRRIWYRAAAFVLTAALGLQTLPVAALAEAVEAQAAAGETELVEGTYVEGEAIVLYHAEPAEEAASEAGAVLASEGEDGGVAALLSEDAAEVPGTGAFALEGFSVTDAWDASAPDNGAALASADGDDAGTEEAPEAQANADDADLRIAYVSKGDTSTEDMIEQLEDLDYVVVAEPNQIYTVDSTTSDGLTLSDDSTTTDDSSTPNDSYYAWQSDALTNDAASVNLDAAIEADADWTTAGSGDGENIVAVIDSGVDFSNPDLANMAWTNPGNIGLEGEHGYDFGSGDDDPTPNADGNEMDSHGTHCAGIIAAQANNKEGIAGVSQSTKIMALKAAPKGGGGEILSSASCAAYEYVIKALVAGQNVVAISNSWGGGMYSAIFDYLVNQAGKLGALSFFAAGNESLNLSEANTYGGTAGLESPYAVVVASTNRYNQLSTFSNYGVTEVDVAAPGSNILSTVAADAAASGNFWSALLVKQGQGESALLCYDNYSTFSETNSDYHWYMQVPCTKDGETTTTIINSDTAVEKGLVSFETTDVSLRGEAGLQVTLNGDELQKYMRSEGGDSSWSVDTYLWGVCIPVTKTVSNPFKDKKLKSLDDYRISSSADVKDDGSATAFIAQCSAYVFGEDGTPYILTGTGTRTQGQYDNFSAAALFESGLSDEAISALNTSDKLTYGVVLEFSTIDRSTPVAAGGSHELTGIVTGFGIGDKNTYVPYALMSGTSMATPMLAGCYAELSKLYPNESALERRGRVVGSTVPTKTASYSEKWQTATDGRFSFKAGALSENGSVLSGNTWSAEADTSANTVTLYGRGLKDVSVAGDDGASLEVDSRAEDGSWIKVRVAASVFDGASHRFDVTDASTNKTHKASYKMPSAKAESVGSELTKVIDLPAQAATSGGGATVSTPAGMVYVDTLGSYAYLCDDPSAEGAAWQELAAPGTPWAERSEGNEQRSSAISYGYAEGTLYAICCDSDGSGGMAVWASTYDLSAGTSGSWSAYTQIGSYTPTAAEGVTTSVVADTGYVACADGTLYCLLKFKTTDTSIDASGTTKSKSTAYAMLLSAAAGTVDFSSHVYATGTEMFDAVALGLVGGSRLSAVAGYTKEDGGSSSNVFVILNYNAADGTWSLEELEGSPTFADTVVGDVVNSVTGDTGSGGVVAGKHMGEAGDLLLCDRDAARAESLGSYGLLASEGYVVEGLQVLNGTLYVCALDARTKAAGGDSSTLGALYALPEAAQAKIVSKDAVVEAAATEGGSASVADWRGGAASSASVRLGDKATWTASAAEGYDFAGWYDENGSLVSSDAAYTQVVGSAAALEARFTKRASPTPGGDSGNDSGSAAKQASARGGVMPRTGDDTSCALPAALAATGAALAVAAIILRRRSA